MAKSLALIDICYTICEKIQPVGSLPSLSMCANRGWCRGSGTWLVFVVTVSRGLAPGKKLLEGAIHNFRDGGTFELGLPPNEVEKGFGDMKGVQFSHPRGIPCPLYQSLPCPPPAQ
jgi:hypothetical protein